MNDPGITALEVESSLPEPTRLDVYLAAKLVTLSRSRLQKLIDAGMVTLDGKPVKASFKLRGGEKLSVTLPESEPAALCPQDIELEIVFEDDYLAVVNKPAGLVVHPGAGVSDGTMVNALLHH